MRWIEWIIGMKPGVIQRGVGYRKWFFRLIEGVFGNEPSWWGKTTWNNKQIANQRSLQSSYLKVSSRLWKWKMERCGPFFCWCERCLKAMFFFFISRYFWRIIKIKLSKVPALLICHEAKEDQVLGHLAGSATNQSGRWWPRGFHLELLPDEKSTFWVREQYVTWKKQMRKLSM